MTKQAIGWGCAFLMLLGLTLSGPLGAQQQDDPFGSGSVRQASPTFRQVEDTAQNAEDRMVAILELPLKTPLSYDEEPLNQILEALAGEYEIPIVFDKAALEDVAISPESEVTVNLRNISLRAALNLMFKEPGLEELCYFVDEEVLLVTTEEKRNETLAVRVYRVDDLLDAGAELFNSSEPPYHDHDRLVDLIVGNVEHDSWQENGSGEGEIQYYPPAMMIISQTHRVHNQVEKLLKKIRETKQQILADSRPRVSQVKPVTRGFLINAELGKDPKQNQQQLKAAIINSVDWSEGLVDEQEKWINFLPNRVLVRHLPTVQSQVEIVLADMQVLKRNQQNPSGRSARFGGRGGFGGGGGGGGGGAFFIDLAE